VEKLPRKEGLMCLDVNVQEDTRASVRSDCCWGIYRGWTWFHQVPHLCWFWINFPINQSDQRDKFTVYVKFRLRTRVKYLKVSAIHRALPYTLKNTGLF